MQWSTEGNFILTEPRNELVDWGRAEDWPILTEAEPRIKQFLQWHQLESGWQFAIRLIVRLYNAVYNSAI